MLHEATLPALLLTAAAGCTSGAEDDTARPCSEYLGEPVHGCLSNAEGRWTVHASALFVRTNPESGAAEAALAVASTLTCRGEDTLIPMGPSRYDAICQDARWWGSDYLVSWGSVGADISKHSVYSLGWSDLAAEGAVALGGATTTQVGYRDCYDIREDDISSSPLYDTYEWTEGTLTIVDIDSSEATLDFDFDGARGRITASVCTVDGTEW